MDKAINRTESSAPISNVRNFNASIDDTAQIPGPREYRIEDFWGDEPAVSEHFEPTQVQPLSTQQALPTPEPRSPLMQRLLTWLDNPLFMAPIIPSKHLPSKTSARHAG